MQVLERNRIIVRPGYPQQPGVGSLDRPLVSILVQFEDVQPRLMHRSPANPWRGQFLAVAFDTGQVLALQRSMELRQPSLQGIALVEALFVKPTQSGHYGQVRLIVARMHFQ
jgi:hypothetical protein